MGCGSLRVKEGHSKKRKDKTKYDMPVKKSGKKNVTEKKILSIED